MAKKMCDTMTDLQRVKTNVPGLDTLLSGGLIMGRNYLVSGPCGSGKTTLGMQFVFNGAMDFDEPSLYVTLEQSKAMMVADMKNFGIDLKKAEEQGKFHLLGGRIAGIHNYMNSVDGSLDNILAEIAAVVKEKNITRVVIDSLNLLVLLIKNKEDRRRIIAGFCNTLSELGCTTLFISETKENSMDISRFGVEEFVMDGVIVLYMMHQNSSFVKGLAVRKLRGSDHVKNISVYDITCDGVVVYPDEKMLSNENF